MRAWDGRGGGGREGGVERLPDGDGNSVVRRTMSGRGCNGGCDGACDGACDGGCDGGCDRGCLSSREARCAPWSLPALTGSFLSKVTAIIVAADSVLCQLVDRVRQLRRTLVD